MPNHDLGVVDHQPEKTDRGLAFSF